MSRHILSLAQSHSQAAAFRASGQECPRSVGTPRSLVTAQRLSQPDQLAPWTWSGRPGKITLKNTDCSLATRSRRANAFGLPVRPPDKSRFVVAAWSRFTRANRWRYRSFATFLFIYGFLDVCTRGGLVRATTVVHVRVNGRTAAGAGGIGVENKGTNLEVRTGLNGCLSMTTLNLL